ncbi:hypothetical protein [Ruminococcus sp.]|uniref:hypothetical protein n=1 Tax=Ruminococcus sp. TaxID=41978 RepID=UPI002E7A05FD|nr:hypothetical protein [Ruminococcus sp.]MEE1398694.1 hypothetical protein [Ruminococcus sp.]
MDKLTKIKEKLDVIYKDYKNNRSQLNGEKTKMAAKLIVEMTFSKNVNPSDVAAELARFSADVARIYFDSLTKSVNIPLEVLDEVLKELYDTDKNPKLSQYYVSKYVFAITSTMKNYKDIALKSAQLPILVAFIARFAVQSNKNRDKFQRLINNTSGVIYLLDYTDIKGDSLTNIWNATKSVFTDLPKDRYESFITEWAVKYGFIASAASEKPTSTDNKVKIEESVVAKETPKEEASVAVQSPVKTESVTPTTKKEEPKTPITNTAVSEKEDKPISVPESKKFDAPAEKPVTVPESKKADAPAEKPVAVPESTKADAPAEKSVASADEKASTNTSEAAVSEKAPAKKSSVQVLYERLKRDIDKEQEAIINAFTNMITPVGKAFESIQGEINKSRELGIENTMLKAKNEELERQIAEMKTKLQENNQSFSSVKAENSDLRQQVRSLEIKIAELDSKLNDAYSINSREASLEAEKVRSELKKAFSFLYEDWLEYEFSDVSEDNYESLQAIIKKIFRSLERNGIDFKGNNE